MDNHEGTLLEVRENLELGIEALRLRKKLANDGEWDELNDLHVAHQEQVLARLDALIADAPDLSAQEGDLGDAFHYSKNGVVFQSIIKAAKLLHSATTEKTNGN